MEDNSGHHFIAIFGGAVAGSEAAYQLANRGFRVVVFDQNILPFGKIEDGLPKWHDKLRNKEENKIIEKLSHPNVKYVPSVKLGQDMEFSDLVSNWGFTAILLATGAWKDRPLPIDNIDEYINKGLYYQNPFVYWYNHTHEPDFDGDKYDIKDDAIVIGGGLASLDVVKILMMETVEKALAKRGITTNMFQLERGINKVLEANELSLQDLGLKGCTLFYRRRAIDMPLTSATTDSAEELQKAQMVRQKILDNFTKKYLFRFEPLWSPVEKVIEDGQLTGLKFQKNQMVDGRLKPIPDQTQVFKAPLFISSIGSIPEIIQGIEMDGQVFKINQDECCRLDGFENVFALGNAVTGRGNIIESQKHGKEIATEIMDDFLKWQEDDYQTWLRGTEAGIQKQVNAIAEHVIRQKFMPQDVIDQINNRITQFQKKKDYDNDFAAWAQKHTPKRLEEMLDAE